MTYTILCDEGFTFTAAELLSPHFRQTRHSGFLETMQEISGDIYVITMSQKLSGSYAAALLAKEALQKVQPERSITVIDSGSALSGELAVARQLHDCLIAGHDRDAAVLLTQNYAKNLSTLGIWGREGIARRVSSAFKGLITKKDPEQLLHQAKKRFARRAEKPIRCVITYCGCPEKAKELGRKLKEACGFRELILVPASALGANLMGTGSLMAAF